MDRRPSTSARDESGAHRHASIRLRNGILALGTLILVSGKAFASSPDARAAHNSAVASGCVKASGLRNARPVGGPIDFDDRVGYTALLIQGNYPQPHMNNKSGQVLCLFNKKSRTPYVSEANGIIESVKR